ncbi:unnamed protein product [Umbelopsis ramanniana]
MSTQDPFIAVKKEVEASLDNATTLFNSWKRIYNTNDLQESIAAVQAHPEAFNLSGSEVQSRNNFITRTRNTVREIEDTIRNPPRKASPRNNQGSSSRHLPGEYDASPFADENQRYIDNASGQQAMMMQDQDTQLDSISGTLHNLKDIAGTMHQEVEDHVVLLDELDQHVDMSSNRLGRAMNRVKYILRKEEESKSGYCVCCLILVLIILLILVITI